MYHLKERAIAEIEVRKSRFYGILLPVSDESEVRELLAAVRKEYPNATHYCTALICGNINRSNDDGEPAGTAGLPMLECLRHHDLHNVLAVVVRYFGGTLLGTGGLVKAYQKAVNEAIDKAVLTQPVETGRYEVTVPYELFAKSEQLLRNNAVITAVSYQEDVCFGYLSANDLSEQFAAISSGLVTPVFMETVIYEQEVSS